MGHELTVARGAVSIMNGEPGIDKDVVDITESLREPMREGNDTTMLQAVCPCILTTCFAATYIQLVLETFLLRLWCHTSVFSNQVLTKSGVEFRATE